MNKAKGRVTVPTDASIIDTTIEILNRWGGDAIRDCDGTELPKQLKDLGKKVYSTYFVSRGDNAWAKQHMDELQHFYVSSQFVVATEATVKINIMKGYLAEQIAPDNTCDIKKYWQVINRSLGETVTNWEYDEKTTTVIINNCVPFNEYSVNFLATAIWDSTQMYNHITNNWTKEHDMPFDVRGEHTNEYMPKRLEEWLSNNPDTNVVRFTTFFYHFTLLFNDMRKEKFVDWFGYNQTVSVKALQDFKEKYGYDLTPEVFIDSGYYNSPFRIPSKQFLDYMEFIQQFVCDNAKKLVDIVHKHGREAMMFLGDNWIGTEPYGEHFKSIGLDAVVGSVGGGATLRMLSEIEGVKYTEARFLPYFFPDVFRIGGEPTREALENWAQARRAILRKPVDRIGYGGYLSLAVDFPDFIECVENICNEFRDIYGKIKNEKPYSVLKVGILNCWGRIRSWQTTMVAHAIYYKQIYSYLGTLESLSGAQFDVSFINFEDVKSGALSDIDVLLNFGDADTAFSGGKEWASEQVVSAIMQFVHNGGGFIGVGEPSAYQKGGRYFQLAPIMGVDMEKSFSLSTNKYNKDILERHFITADNEGIYNFGEGKKNVYAFEGTEVLFSDDGCVQLCANNFGKGKGVYISGLPYTPHNSRMLIRACYYCANKQNDYNFCTTTNVFTECAFYPDRELFAVVNNSGVVQSTCAYAPNGEKIQLSIAPYGIVWIDLKKI